MVVDVAAGIVAGEVEVEAVDARVVEADDVDLFPVPELLGRRTAWMLGSIPPWAMVTPDRSLFNFSSFLIAGAVEADDARVAKADAVE